LEPVSGYWNDAEKSGGIVATVVVFGFSVVVAKVALITL
jgi:hypothetical protein